MTNIPQLSAKLLPTLPDSILRPTYDRSSLTPGIVHIGVGNFHRAHQSWYLHRLMQQGLAHDWAIIGAGVRHFDGQMRSTLAKQDYLTTLIELDPNGSSAEIVGSMIGYIPVEEGNTSLILQMADPAIRIVSLTVTEGGYYVNPITGGLDVSHVDIEHDRKHPERPCTAFGAIVAALQLRRASGIQAFACQSCDNLQGNGKVLRETVVELAALSDLGLAEWISAECTFPNSMIDCIVPATGSKERALALGFGIRDPVCVTHENFRQWVIEDKFCAGRPDWERVGANFSDNVHGHETQKIRILNAGHQVVANAAEVLGIKTICDAMSHRLIHTMFNKVARQEIVPQVRPVSGMAPDEYVSLIERRFLNSAVDDTTRRVAFDGSSRHPGFVLPTVRDALKNNGDFQGLALAEASWARMCEGTREDGTQIEPNDPFWEELSNLACAARDAPIRWLKRRQTYGDLALNPRFSSAFEQWLKVIYRDGMEAAIQQYMKGK